MGQGQKQEREPICTTILVFQQDRNGAMFSTMDRGKIKVFIKYIDFVPKIGVPYKCYIYRGAWEDCYLGDPTEETRANLTEEELISGSCIGEVAFKRDSQGKVRAYHPVTGKVVILEDGQKVALGIPTRVSFREEERVVYASTLETPRECAARHERPTDNPEIHVEKRWGVNNEGRGSRQPRRDSQKNDAPAPRRTEPDERRAPSAAPIQNPADRKLPPIERVAAANTPPIERDRSKPIPAQAKNPFQTADAAPPASPEIERYRRRHGDALPNSQTPPTKKKTTAIRQANEKLSWGEQLQKLLQEDGLKIDNEK